MLQNNFEKSIKTITGGKQSINCNHSSNNSENTLANKLQSRHLNMIAIGGSIGTGIFLASGYAISVAGPGGALLAYILMAVIVYFLMTSLGEMSAYNPTAGTFCEYSNLYVGKSFGFAMGYNYWLNWAITIAAEISAATALMNYWFPHVNSLIFSILFFVSILISNLYSVKVYGEIEYLLSFVKVSTIIVFIILGIAAIFHTPHFGVHNWEISDAPFHDKWYGFLAVFLFAGFSFQGTELVAVASAETKNPEAIIPKSLNLVFLRLMLFYVLTIAIISLLIPFNDALLTSQDNVSMSPFTLIFNHYLSHYAGDIVNLIALIAVLSAANASMYSATRILWYLGKTNQAPKLFQAVNKQKIPITALAATALIGSLAFVSSFIGNGIVFNYLVQISSLSGFIAWFGIALSHYQFRKKYQGNVKELKFRAKYFPIPQVISMIIIIGIIGLQFIPIVQKSNYHITDLIITYLSVILFCAIFLFHKVYTHLLNRIALIQCKVVVG